MRERVNPGRRTAFTCEAVASAGRGGEGSKGGDGGVDGGASLSSSDSSVRLAPMLFERRNGRCRGCDCTPFHVVASEAGSGRQRTLERSFVRWRQSKLLFAFVESSHEHRITADVISVVSAVSTIVCGHVLAT
eukprot:447722-Pleurochrysis_carterae.AAC.1